MRRALGLGTACAVLLAACGGDNETDNQYVEAVNRAQTGFARTVEGLQEDVTPTSTPQQDRRTLRRFTTAVDGAVAELRAAEPPEEVAALHRRLIAEIGSYGEELERAGRAIGSSDVDRVREAGTELQTRIAAVTRRVQTTIDDINDELGS